MSFADCISLLAEQITAAIHKIPKTAMPKKYVQEAIDKAIAYIRSALTNLSMQNNTNRDNYKQHRLACDRHIVPSHRKFLSKARQSGLVWMNVDKTQTTILAACKLMAVQAVSDNLTKSGRYEQLDISHDEAVSHDETF